MRTLKIGDGRDPMMIKWTWNKLKDMIHLFFGTIVLLEGGYLHTRSSISS